MGVLKIVIPNEIEKVFRRLAMQRFEFTKGAISLAAQSAIEEWMKNHIEISTEKNPVDEISGLMKKVKKSSVELQHEIGGIVVKKYANRH
jgi:chemotaxis regulatin CheY-phosphate phosphatase CheZ